MLPVKRPQRSLLRGPGSNRHREDPIAEQEIPRIVRSRLSPSVQGVITHRQQNCFVSIASVTIATNRAPVNRGRCDRRARGSKGPRQRGPPAWGVVHRAVARVVVRRAAGRVERQHAGLAECGQPCRPLPGTLRWSGSRLGVPGRRLEVQVRVAGVVVHRVGATHAVARGPAAPPPFPQKGRLRRPMQRPPIEFLTFVVVLSPEFPG